MQGAGMILFILFFGIAAGAVLLWLDRSGIENSAVSYGIKSVLFFFSGLCFAVSALKSYLGEPLSTLPESFWDIGGGGKTYLHYGAVFAVIAVAAPLLLKRLFGMRRQKLVNAFCFIFALGLLCAVATVGRIDNITYCILYAVCMASALCIVFFHRGQIAYASLRDAKKSFVDGLPFAGAWFAMSGLYLPNELFISNMDEFAGNYYDFFLITLLGSIAGIFLILAIFLFFVPEKLTGAIYLLVGGLCCAGYIQTMFLNGTLDAMNGSGQSWAVQTLVCNGVIWAAILSFAVAGCRKTAIRKIYKAMCIYISLIQIAALGWLAATSDLNRESETAAVTKEGALEISGGNNVLVFVLDNYDSGWFETIYEGDGSILIPLADFTYYRNGTSQFAHTNPGIPYMLAGDKWQEGGFRQDGYLSDIASLGTDVRIYTELSLIGESLRSKMGNYKAAVPVKYDIGKTFGTMLKTSMYKTAPFLMKPLYEYYSSDIKDMTYNENIWSIDNDKLFYDDIVAQGLTVSDKYERAFRFYHMRGPHAPFYLTEDLQYEPTGRTSTLEGQGKGCLKVVYKYMELLKELEKYDDATIIITADHGQGWITDGERYSGKPDKISRTLFLVKKPGEHHEQMAINEAPVSQAELFPTILDAFGMEYGAYGRTFGEIPADEKRERRYIDDYMNHNITYLIDGHAADIGSWSIERAEYFKDY